MKTKKQPKGKWVECHYCKHYGTRVLKPWTSDEFSQEEYYWNYACHICWKKWLRISHGTWSQAQTKKINYPQPIMPKIDKPKRKTKSLSKNKIKPELVVVPTAQTKTASKTSKSKHSATEYYNCLLTYANQNWHHPLTGQKKKITACCRDCKQNAPALNSEKDKELVKLITSYKQVGVSLAKLLKPIK